MISFFNTSNAKYDKIFFDFEIKDINEETFALEKEKMPILFIYGQRKIMGTQLYQSGIFIKY